MPATNPDDVFRWQQYQAAGGALDLGAWIAAGRPSTSADDPQQLQTGPQFHGEHVGQVITYEGASWRWDGFTWALSQEPPAPPPDTPPDTPPEVVDGEPKPTVDEQDGTLSPGGEWVYSDKVNDWVRTGAGDDDDVVTPLSDSDRAAYEVYRTNGGRLSAPDWLAAGKPSGPEPEPEAEGEGEEDFSQQLAAAVEAYQQQIGEWGERQRAEAQRLGARDIGKMSRMTQQALLAQGRTAGEIEQLTAGGMEAGARSMADLIKQINLQTQQQQAGASQFGIGTMISGEELGVRERQIAQAGGQFQQQLAQQMAQFQQRQQQQAGQFGQQFGLSQQQLAQQAGQFGQQMKLGQQQAKYGFYGDIAQGIGSFFGGLFG